MDKLIIVGVSTTAKTIYEFVNKYHLYEVIGFAVDRAYLKESEFCGIPVYAIEDLNVDSDSYLFVAMQWNRLNADRKGLYLKLKNLGYRFANIISPHAIVNGSIEGDNCWISDFAIVDFGAVVGSNVFVKSMALVATNTKIGSHCFIGAKSTIGGAATIGDQSFIGLNATIFDCVTIGEKCIVGAGTIVKRNIPNYCRCIVSIENTFIKQYNEDEIESKLLFAKNVR